MEDPVVLILVILKSKKLSICGKLKLDETYLEQSSEFARVAVDHCEVQRTEILIEWHVYQVLRRNDSLSFSLTLSMQKKKEEA